MFGGSGSSKATKCKTQLRLVVSRIHILRKKREIQVKHLRRDVALLLQNNQEGNARARVEHAIREQNMVDAYALIEGYSQFLESRIQNISGHKECPPELKEAVASLIYAGPRCADLPELLEIRSIFSAKYGKQFIATILELRVGCGVSKKILDKLSSQPLSAETKINFMTEVAKEHNVRWQPADLSIPSDFKQPEEGPPPQQQTQTNTQQNTSPKSPLDHRKPTAPAAIHSTRTQQERKSDSEDEAERPAVSKPSSTRPVETAAHKQQYVPFVRPTTGPSTPTDPYAQYTKGIINPYSQKDSSPPPPPTPPPAATNGDPYEEYRKKFMGNHAYADVATAAEAAAQSADHAAAAARAAATLAHKHLSRESSMAEEAVAAAAVSQAKVPVLKTKVSPVNLEDRVSSYLNSHANDTDSSEWDTPSPMPREDQFSPMINPSRDLRKEAEAEVREQIEQNAGTYYQRRHRMRPARLEKQHHGYDENLFRKEASPEQKVTGSPLGKPVFDDFAGNDHLGPSKLQESHQPVFDDFANNHLGPSKIQEYRQPVYDDFVAAPAGRDDGRDSGPFESKPVFDEAPAPAPAVSKVDSFTQNMKAMHGNLRSRTDKIFEKEDSDLSSPTSRPRRAAKANFGVGVHDHEDDSSSNLSTDHKTQSASTAPTQEEESVSWWRSRPPTRPPPKLNPKLHTEKLDHLDFQRQFQGAGVDYSEQPAGAARKHRLGGSSVRTKRA